MRTRTMLVVFLLAGALFSQTLFSQTKTHEEEVVRITYAKLSYADEIGIVIRAMGQSPDQMKIPESSLDKALNSRLDFQLSNFKVGNVKEIEGRISSEISGFPEKSTDPVLDVTPSTFDYKLNKDTGTWTLYVQIKWKEYGYDPRAGASDWPMVEILKLPEMGGTFTRYATYTVTSTFENKSITYNTAALFETKTDGSENVHFLDVHSGIPTLDLLARTTIFPAPFTKTNLRNVPVVRRWLTTNAQACNSKRKDGDICCDTSSGRCGVETHELPAFDPAKPIFYQPYGQPRLVMAGFHPNAKFHLNLFNGQACSSFSKPVASPRVSFDASGHALDASGLPLGNHILTLNISGGCNYSEGATSPGPCSVDCSVGSSSGWLDQGKLSGIIPNFHVGSTVGNKGGASSPNGGTATCESHVGGSIVSCLSSTCNVGLTINATASGIGTTITFPSTQVFGDKNDFHLDCPAQKSAPTPTPTPVAQNDPPPPPDPGDPCGTGFNPNDGGNGPVPVCSPIIIDLTGNGFELTDAAHGVKFDWTGNGRLIQTGWTANGDNAFLALDRNNNGVINSGRELFGNFTAQANSNHPNGFAALALYDDPGNGGNGDGIIDERDKVFSSLRLWVDANHDGICQPGELHTLPELGVYNVSLDYSLSRRTDQYGNAFRYRAKINVGVHGEADKVGRTAYDVFFVDK